MQTILAMAGLAEAVHYYSILICRALIILAVVLALWGFVRRSRGIAWTAFAIISISVAFVQPWFIFVDRPVPTDPDAVYWIAKWRVLAATLIGGFVLCVSLVVSTLLKRRSKEPIKSSTAQRP